MSTDNVGLARFRGGFELVAHRTGVASRRSHRGDTAPGSRASSRMRPETRRELVHARRGLIARATAGALVGYAHAVGFSDDAVLRMRTFRRGARRAAAHERRIRHIPIIVRYAHLGDAELVRPEKDAPWQLKLQHDSGVATLAESPALRVAGKNVGDTELRRRESERSATRDRQARRSRRSGRLFHARRVARNADVVGPIPRCAEAARPKIRKDRFPNDSHYSLANRSFWGRGGTGSDEKTPLFRLPAVDRLALEMAANEDIERRALMGELEALHAAWRDAEEIAAIADEMFADDVLEEFKRQYYDASPRGTLVSSRLPLSSCCGHRILRFASSHQCCHPDASAASVAERRTCSCKLGVKADPPLRRALRDATSG